MGILDKIVKQNEHLATGRNSLLSLRGVMKSYNENTNSGTVEYVGRTYPIKIDKNSKYGIYETFPFGVPENGEVVLINLDESQKNAIMVIPSDYKRRMNFLEIMKKTIG